MVLSERAILKEEGFRSGGMKNTSSASRSMQLEGHSLAPSRNPINDFDCEADTNADDNLEDTESAGKFAVSKFADCCICGLLSLHILR